MCVAWINSSATSIFLIEIIGFTIGVTIFANLPPIIRFPEAFIIPKLSISKVEVNNIDCYGIVFDISKTKKTIWGTGPLLFIFERMHSALR